MYKSRYLTIVLTYTSEYRSSIPESRRDTRIFLLQPDQCEAHEMFYLINMIIDIYTELYGNLFYVM
jgi:hypothetical protein